MGNVQPSQRVCLEEVRKQYAIASTEKSHRNLM
jgi:hypothetical protein